MLNKIALENFKSWESVQINLGRITAFFGTNSSGKTSILQFLLLMKQTRDATDRALALDLGGPYVMLGTYRDFIFRHDEGRSFIWRIAWDQADELALVNPIGKRTDAFAKSRNISVESKIASVRGAPTSMFLKYQFDKNTFSLEPKTEGGKEFDLRSGSTFDFKRTQGRAWQLPGPVKSYGFPDQARTYYQNSEFLAKLVASFEEQMDRTYYLGPLREYPKREYVWTKARPSDVGPKGERAIEAILAATERNEQRNLKPKAKNKSFQQMIAYWLREMGLIHEFNVKEIKKGSNIWQALVIARKGAPEVLLTEVGFGVSQVLPVLTLLYYVPEGSTVILEQPEIHLHPLAQAGLADVLANVASHRRIQIIVESHSEHLLLRLQRRVADETIPADFLRMYFADATGGNSKLIDLDVDKYGVIQNWPPDFMGDAVGELEAAAKARISRLKQRLTK